MKKKIWKACSVFLTTLMVFGCAGCGSTADTGNNADNNAQGTEQDSGSDDGDDADSKDAGGEKVSITLWSQFSDPNSTDGNYVAFYSKGITPISLSEKDLWPGLMIYGIHAFRMAGAEDFNAALNGTASYDTPELIEAAKLVQELSAKGGFGDSAMGTSEDAAVAALKQGKAAMMFMGSWLNGDCEAEDAAVKGKINVIKFPVIDGGKGSADEFHGGSGETF